MRYTLRLLIVGLLASFDCLGQSTSPPPPVIAKTAPVAHGASHRAPELVVLNTVKGTSVGFMWLAPMKCDVQGNLYLRNRIEGVSAIHKLNANGKEIALPQPDSAKPDLRPVFGGHFSVGKDGSVYELVGSGMDKKHHVFIYKPDGSLKSDITLASGFPWLPALVAVFPSGNLLVTGLEYDHDPSNLVKWPVTGVFGSNGSLLKEVKLEDDDAIHNMAAVGDSRVTAPEAPGVNHAVQLGEMDVANDGNIYLMRHLSPPIVYAISPDGEVVRRFIVDPGQPGYVPSGMHIAGNRIELEFFQPQKGNPLIKIVDLAGNGLATYHPDPEAGIGAALACYTSDPDRFVFLGGDDNGVIAVKTVGVR
jgi:hypothetical protein